MGPHSQLDHCLTGVQATSVNQSNSSLFGTARGSGGWVTKKVAAPVLYASRGGGKKEKRHASLLHLYTDLILHHLMPQLM